jgi:hypothetical protein
LKLDTPLPSLPAKLNKTFVGRTWWVWNDTFVENREHAMVAVAFLLGVDDPQFASVALKNSKAVARLWAHWARYLDKDSLSSAVRARGVKLYLGAYKLDEAEALLEKCFAHSQDAELDMDCLEAKALLYLALDKRESPKGRESGKELLEKLLKLPGVSPEASARIRMIQAGVIIEPADASMGHGAAAENLIKDHLGFLSGAEQGRAMFIMGMARLRNGFVVEAAQAMRIATSLLPVAHPVRHTAAYAALEIETGRFSLVNSTTLSLAEQWFFSAHAAHERGLASKKDVWSSLFHLAQHALTANNRKLAIASAESCVPYAGDIYEHGQCLRLSGMGRALGTTEQSELAESAKEFLAARVAFEQASPPKGGPESFVHARACEEAANALVHPALRTQKNDQAALKWLQTAKEIYLKHNSDKVAVIEAVSKRINEVETRIEERKRGEL